VSPDKYRDDNPVAAIPIFIGIEARLFIAGLFLCPYYCLKKYISIAQKCVSPDKYRDDNPVAAILNAIGIEAGLFIVGLFLCPYYCLEKYISIAQKCVSPDKCVSPLSI